MKKLIALVMVSLMVLSGVSFAAEWPEGCSPAQPYSHLPEVNLSKTMGYIMLYPRTKLMASNFCDMLKLYLPRTDLKVGSGKAHLYEVVEGKSSPVEVCAIDFSDPNSVSIREMTEEELTTSFMWGSGSCIEMHLNKSLEFGDKTHKYYVLMDEGCFTAADGALKSISITSHEAWDPAIEGDYGISGLYYADAKPVAKPAEKVEAAKVEEVPQVGIEVVPGTSTQTDETEQAPAEAATEAPTAAPTEAPTEAPTKAPKKTGTDKIVTMPDEGDKVCFDLVIGGNAKLAVLYSENGSVEFPEIEFTQSASVEGTVVGEDVMWGVAFYDANGYIFDTIGVSR